MSDSISKEAVLAAIPGNWCDALLTGPNKVLPETNSYRPSDIEKLLNAIRARIEELPAVNSHARLEAEVKALRDPFRNADAKDWAHLDKLLGHSGHGQFWRAVFAEVRQAVSEEK